MVRAKKAFFSLAVIFSALLTFVISAWALPPSDPVDPARARYVFLFIGDGMGRAQRDAAEAYLNAVRPAGSGADPVGLRMNALPTRGRAATWCADAAVTDSAAAGTALSTGSKTACTVLGLRADKTTPMTTIAERARNQGFRVGIMTSVSIDHATPAAFYAHQPNRNAYYRIALDLSRSGFDYFAGGGFKEPHGRSGAQPDAWEAARLAGYTVASGRAEVMALRPGAGKVIARGEFLDPDAALPYDIDRRKGDLSLADLTRKGIELLDNPRGFFMMVEGGKIDWACHANDPGTAVREVLALDDAVGEALWFADSHPGETLVIVTADHETGGMRPATPGGAFDGHLAILARQSMSFRAFDQRLAAYKKTRTPETARVDDILPLAREAFGLAVLSGPETAALQARARSGDPTAAVALLGALTEADLRDLAEALPLSMRGRGGLAADDQAALLYGKNDPVTSTLTRILGAKAGIAWGSHSHTGADVPISATGAGAELFTGPCDNTGVSRKMAAVMGLPAR